MIFLYMALIGIMVFLLNWMYKIAVYQGMKIGFRESEKRDRIRKDLCRIEGYEQALKVFASAYEHWKNEMIETKNWAEFKERDAEEKRKIAEIHRLLEQDMNERRHILEAGLGTAGRTAFGRLQGTLIGGFSTCERVDIMAYLESLMAQTGMKKCDPEKKKDEPT